MSVTFPSPPSEIPDWIDAAIRHESARQIKMFERLMEPARLKRIAWEAEHPYRAFWWRLGRRLRPIWARVTLVWRVLRTGDCGCEG